MINNYNQAVDHTHYINIYAHDDQSATVVGHTVQGADLSVRNDKFVTQTASADTNVMPAVVNAFGTKTDKSAQGGAASHSLDLGLPESRLPPKDNALLIDAQGSLKQPIVSGTETSETVFPGITQNLEPFTWQQVKEETPTTLTQPQILPVAT